MLKSIKLNSNGYRDLNLIIPEEYRVKNSLTEAEAKDQLIKQVGEGKLQVVYRLKTDKLLHNPWTFDLMSLCGIFCFSNDIVVSDDIIIDGSNPKNIEVAFLKIK